MRGQPRDATACIARAMKSSGVNRGERRWGFGAALALRRGDRHFERIV